LKKKWLTKDAYFRLTTSLIGINVVDTYKLADFHGVINFTKKSIEKKMTIVRFAGILGYQLIANAARLSEGHSHFLSPLPLQNCNLISVPTFVNFLLKEAAEKGVVLCGGSAGCVCWFSDIHTDCMRPNGVKNPPKSMTLEEVANC
jgi:hypothetical protein